MVLPLVHCLETHDYILGLFVLLWWGFHFLVFLCFFVVVVSFFLPFWRLYSDGDLTETRRGLDGDRNWRSDNVRAIS